MPDRQTHLPQHACVVFTPVIPKHPERAHRGTVTEDVRSLPPPSLSRADHGKSTGMSKLDAGFQDSAADIAKVMVSAEPHLTAARKLFQETSSRT